ncbi:hydroxycarboxylic acid receptor 2-like isoform X2 [Scyliorhinus canicula]|uniref:hydroxycarboxylic acid receptor 2-like isoform X2 n=1 Tax=Scyliorhinus canicula TaxID=7830 RepID=UPI0018F5DCA2|nr:hydroxycarboxylic acid receptor 2-like isoform X2 [Scyliorhinus canicula]
MSSEYIFDFPKPGREHHVPHNYGDRSLFQSGPPSPQSEQDTYTLCSEAPIILVSTSCITWKLKQMEIESRGKYKRAVKLVIVVAVVFVLCFLPTNIAVIAVLITRLQVPGDCKSYETAVQIFYNTLFMTYLNTALDPVIYYFSSSTFKDALMKALAPLKLNCFRSTTRRSTQRGPRREMFGGQDLNRTRDCNIDDQPQSDVTLTATSSD